MKPLATAWRLVKRPLDRFLRIQAASALLLFLVTAVALGISNSRWNSVYRACMAWPLPFQPTFLRGAHGPLTLPWLINDGLMVVFFFVVGIEIRRELAVGELSQWKRAILPAAAALGGMLGPALLYLGATRLFLHAGSSTTRGWGIPMATDIAFAVGVLTLLGKRVPPALRVLLLSLAVIDDLGAILVIAVAYSQEIRALGVGCALLLIGVVLVMQRLGVVRKSAYLVVGLCLWQSVHYAGIHPTIAGVAMGLLTPVHSSTQTSHTGPSEDATRSPGEHLIEVLHPWVAWLIMPVFALANAGVNLGSRAESLAHADAPKVTLGVLLALLLGKPLGVLCASGLLLVTKLGALPKGLSFRHLVVLGLCAGVGFTMAIFVAQLAFVDPSLLAAAKLGIIAASGAAVVLALGAGLALLPRLGMLEAGKPVGAQSADEAESSTEL
jgi:Na+:H+ antiporter, NhaA family